MTSDPILEPLLSYTGWQRQLWRTWFGVNGPAPLAVSTGPHGDGRMPTIGALIHHIFSAELRYVDRLLARPVSDTSAVPTNEVEAIFGLGERSREQFTELLRTLPAAAWDTPAEFPLFTSRYRATPRKVILHTVTHEIRHWAQIATLLRMTGHKVELQDMLFSPILGETTRL